MPTQKNIFEFSDKFGYESPFSDWITEEREKREERERIRNEQRKQFQNDADLPQGGIHLVLDNEDIAVKNEEGYHSSQAVKTGIAKYFFDSYQKAEEYLRKSLTATEILDSLAKQSKNIRIHYSEGINGLYTGIDLGTAWNPFLWSIVDNYGVNCPAMILIHELYHQYNDLKVSDEKISNDPNETKYKSEWEKHQGIKHDADYFGVEDEYITTMFVNKIIEEAKLLDAKRKTYKNFGYFRIWGTFATKTITSTYDNITNRQSAKRAYYLDERFINFNGQSVKFLFEDDATAIKNKGGINIPGVYKRIGI